MVRRAGGRGRVDVNGRSPTRKEGVEQERVTGLGRSPARPFCNSISEILKMSPRFCNMPDAVNNDVQVEVAKGSHHLPIPWPWPTRWAGMGTGCHQGRWQSLRMLFVRCSENSYSKASQEVDMHSRCYKGAKPVGD